MQNLSVTLSERDRLRRLAEKQLEYSKLDVMKKRTAEWYAHNACRGEKPMIIVEPDTFFDEIADLQCSSPFARQIERRILMNILPYELWDDDAVVSDTLELSRGVGYFPFGFEIKEKHSLDSAGRSVGFEYIHPFEEITGNLDRLADWTFSYNPDSCAERKEKATEILGDILRVEMMNNCHQWSYMLTEKVVKLIGLEQLMYSMYDEPDELHGLMEYLTVNTLRFIDWQEEQNAFTMNNKNQYVGAGSCGFSYELKEPEDGRIKAKNIWCNINSQESSTISPAMYKEFVYPYYARIAERFGAIYYGCCEPVNPIWKGCLENMPNLRKVSVSAWCDEEFMGEALRGKNIVYSRKPAARFLGSDRIFDEDGYKKYMLKTINAAKGCTPEILFRDVYTLCGDPDRPRKAVAILRCLIEKYWNK